MWLKRYPRLCLWLVRRSHHNQVQIYLLCILALSLQETRSPKTSSHWSESAALDKCCQTFGTQFRMVSIYLALSWRRQWHPLQYSCLENPMDGGAWWAAVHGVARSRTRLSGFTFAFHFHALEKEMATHSSVLAWRIPGTGEPVGLWGRTESDTTKAT